jgi:hypothetical protein
VPKSGDGWLYWEMVGLVGGDAWLSGEWVAKLGDGWLRREMGG